MPYQKLQVKLLSKSGELLNCINCFAGQVTVFRANSAAELQPYQRAFSGVPGPERFSLTLDGQPFASENHILVGFGEYVKDSSSTVSSWLAASGITENAIESLLVSYGLEGTSAIPCSSLTPDQERRVRLLISSFSQNKVIVLNNPFEAIQQQWRERFAELVVNSARKLEQIVVVPSLSYRPQCWIDNESIARTQVGQAIQKTIGFGSEANDVNQLLQQLRDTFKDDEAVQKIISGSVSKPLVTEEIEEDETVETDLTEAPIAETFAQINTSKFNPLQTTAIKYNKTPRIMLGVVTLLAVVVFSFFYAQDKADNSKIATTKTKALETSALIKKKKEKDIDKAAVTKTNLNKEATVPTKKPTGIIETKPTEITPRKIKTVFVLDEYSQDIKSSILATYQGTAKRVREKRVSPSVKQKSNKRVSKKQSESSDFIRSLGTLSETPERTTLKGTGFTPKTNRSEELEARREAIRKKFLEAVQRASNNNAGS